MAITDHRMLRYAGVAPSNLTAAPHPQPAEGSFRIGWLTGDLQVGETLLHPLATRGSSAYFHEMASTSLSTRSIGRLAALTGVKVPTIRFYEQIGIMPAPERTPSDRRVYDDAALRRLSFVRHARDLGFDLDSIRSLLDLADEPERPCSEANAIAERHLAVVMGKIARLKALQAELSRMTAECAGGRVSACKVIEVLHDHDRCSVDHGGTRSDF